MKSCTVLVASLVSVAVAAADEAPVCSNSRESCYECSLYLAPSTIPGAGLGIFSGVARKPGDRIGQGDVLIPIVDAWYHLKASKFYEGEENTFYSLDPTTDYVWHGPEMGMQFEVTDSENWLTAFVPGLDSAINCNLALINVDKDDPKYNELFHRSKDPGAGAISPYENITTIVTADIPVGGELFKFYGDSWFTTRQDTFPDIPLSHNYGRAEDLLNTFVHKLGNLNGHIQSEVWDLMTIFPLPSRTVRALPKNHSVVEQVREQGIRSVHQPQATRSLEELERIGRCLDTIYPGPSTISQAGRGAFAKRSFREGEAVLSTPLLFAIAEDVFQMREGDWNNKRKSVPGDKVVAYQLLLNYCWHHPDSSIYLCPYGYEINYFNHDNARKPNVRIQWAQVGFLGHNASLLQESPAVMVDQASPGLIWDVIALRDIQEGEELLFDYGDTWDAAWREHVANWQPGSSNYTSGRTFNALHANAAVRTQAEQIAHPYPDNLAIHCLNEIGDATLTAIQAAELWTLDQDGVPCRVVKRHVVEGDNGTVITTYDVELDYYYWVEEDFDYHDEVLVVENVVREAIAFVDRPYSTDIFLSNAFRHPIGIPDDIFPDAWKGFDAQTDVDF